MRFSSSEQLEEKQTEDEEKKTEEAKGKSY
jgi:hypothetical protein